MVCDWVKMRTDLYRDPKVCLIADQLLLPDGELAQLFVCLDQPRSNALRNVTRNVMRNVTVGALVTLWGVTRHRGRRKNDDLLLPKTTSQIIDDITDLPGLGAAMTLVGWAKETADGVIFPNFYGEFNSDPNENVREKNAERQRRHREKRNALRNVTPPLQSNGREEKRREEKNNKKPPTPLKQKFDPEVIQLPFASESFRAAWRVWCRHRVEIKKRLTESQAHAQLRNLGSMGESLAIATINHSVAGGWQGLFPPDGNGKPIGRSKVDEVTAELQRLADLEEEQERAMAHE